VLLAAALVAAASGRGDELAGSKADGHGAGGAASTTAPSRGADDAAGPGSSSTAPRRSPTSTGPRSSGSGSNGSAPTTSTSGDRTTDPAPGSGDAEPTAADDGSQGPPGAFARTLLRPHPATGLVLERAAQAGATLSQSAVNRSAGVVSEAAGKPVDVRPMRSLSSSDTDWTAEEIRAAADGAAVVAQGGGRAVVRLLVLQGTFEGRDDVLGVAVRGDVLALFADNIAGAATPLVSRSSIEDAVLLHELGHVLGLVDLARDTGRADKEHPGHSTNSASVMYWAVESSLVGQVLHGPPPRDFDAQDRADLVALRNGA
jgi:hypothetical protein